MTDIQLLIDAMCLQENDVPLPMLLDFHGWTENTMGHENDGHNFFQVDFRCKGAEFLQYGRKRRHQLVNNYACH